MTPARLVLHAYNRRLELGVGMVAVGFGLAVLAMWPERWPLLVPRLAAMASQQAWGWALLLGGCLSFLGALVDIRVLRGAGLLVLAVIYGLMAWHVSRGFGVTLISGIVPTLLGCIVLAFLPLPGERP